MDLIDEKKKKKSKKKKEKKGRGGKMFGMNFSSLFRGQKEPTRTSNKMLKKTFICFVKL